MRTLSLDLETYSDVNLAKCGVYKYAESPDFEILLFGYAVDGREVKVVDLAQGETLPEEILEALTDDSISLQCQFRTGVLVPVSDGSGEEPGSLP